MGDVPRRAITTAFKANKIENAHLINLLAFIAFPRDQTDDQVLEPSGTLYSEKVDQGLVVLCLPVILSRGDFFVTDGRQGLSVQGR